jgi:hypothetical protein
MQPKTIQLFLPDGNPSSLKIAEITNKNVRAYEVPRTNLQEHLDRKDLGQPALYILLDRENEHAYIGESECFSDRIKSHVQSKDFWELALIFIAKDNGLDKGDVKYLESLAIRKATDANRINLMNSTQAKLNNLHEFKAATIAEFFQDIQLLTSTLGFNIFDQAISSEVSEVDYWFCSNKKTRAKAIYNEQGFTVLADSIIQDVERESFAINHPFAAEERRRLLQEHGELFDKEQMLWRLKNDITFKSPNKAAGFVIGGSANAWVTWKKADGRTMDQVFRL